MVIVELIELYESLQLELREAIRREEDEKIEALDTTIQDVFDRILDHVPGGLDERLALTDFLLNFLDRMSRPSPLAQAVKDKILKLVRSDAANE